MSEDRPERGRRAVKTATVPVDRAALKILVEWVESDPALDHPPEWSDVPGALAIVKESLDE